MIKLHLAKFIDHEPYVISLMAHYAMMTHVWDAFSAVPYLRLKGQPGTGKSRCLKVMKDLCYRTVDLGAGMSKAALYRSIDNVGGTAIIDEAEFGGVDLQAAVFQVLNKGYEKDGISPSAFRIRMRIGIRVISVSVGQRFWPIAMIWVIPH